MRSSLTLLFSFVLVLGFAPVMQPVNTFADEVEHAGEGHDDGEHDGGAHGDEEHHETGLPMNFKGDLALWSLIVFILFVIILRFVAWGPLVSSLDKREAKIRDDIATAEANRVKAERMLAEHQEQLANAQDEVREIIAEARRDADQARTNIISEANAEAEAMKERALSEIARAKDAALSSIFETMAGQVTTATEHVLGRSLNDDDQQRLVAEALSQLPDRG